MEKAVLKTLAYAGIFDYPLKAYEIHKWLLGRKATLRQVEKALLKLNQQSRIKNKGAYYFLPKRYDPVRKRKRRQKQSANYFKKAWFLVQILKIVPWVKLVGVSGGLAMDNASKVDDIDLFIITDKNRLWLSRILALGLLSLTGQRRKAGENGRKIAGRLCINILLEEDSLEQRNKDIYLAHEVLQMKPVWYRDGIYQKYLEDNAWAFRFLPNWTTALSSRRRAPTESREGSNKQSKRAKMTLERLAKWLQLKMMSKPQGMERIQEGALYFHPQDCRQQILQSYRKKVKKIISP